MSVASRSLSIYSTRPKLVAVIFARRDLLRAKALRPAPDFLELRLDALAPIVDQIDAAMHGTGIPLIITARHPREGGFNDLGAAARAALLRRFPASAADLDIQ